MSAALAERVPLPARILGLAGDTNDGDPGRAPERELQVRGLQLFLLLHITARSWLSALSASGFEQSWLIPLAILASGALLLALLPGWTRSATGLAALVWVARLYFRWPQSSNHFYLELVCLVFVWLLGARGDENRKLLLQAVRWIVVIAIFYTGAQKVMYGSYFQGQFLAWQVATTDNFAAFFRFFMGAEEFSRLRHIHPEIVGAGPFVVRSPLFLAMSNSVYVFEILTPVFLLLRRTRVLATIAFALFMVAIEAGALELVFGLLMVNLLLLFLPRALNYRALPAATVCYLALFAARYALGMKFFH